MGWIFAGVVVFGCAVGLFGFWRGYEYGVKETEIRWSEAVGRSRG